MRSVAMIKKTLLALATSAVGAVFAGETYRVTLFQPTTNIGTTLKPGEYKLELKDSKAIIKSRKENVASDVRVEYIDQKDPSTSVRYNSGNGQYEVEEIRLGGTKTKLVFTGAEGQPAGQ